ncbi:MAG: hypothetical protein Q9167_008114 [Letrouitia subvulpina]
MGSCNLCNVAGDIHTVTVAPKPPVDNPTHFALELSDLRSSTYLVVQDYTIGSNYLSEGSCIMTESTVSLTSAFSILRASNAITKAFQRTAELSFIDFLGFSTCEGGGELVLPTELAQVDNITGFPYLLAQPSSVSSKPKNFDNTTMTPDKSIDTAFTTLLSSLSDQSVSPLQVFTTAATQSSAENATSNEGLQTGSKIGIGVSVPSVALFLLLFGYFLWQRQQFLNQKPNRQPEELDNDGAAQGAAQEVHAETRRVEVEGDGAIHEMTD